MPAHHSHTINNTVIEINGKACLMDDFLPRAQLKVQFQARSLTSTDENEIKNFSEKYVVFV